MTSKPRTAHTAVRWQTFNERHSAKLKRVIKETKNKIIGIIILIVNVIWTGHWIWVFYGYHFTNILWFYMYPDWILILNMIIGLIGIAIGIQLIKDKIVIKKAIVIGIPILILAFLNSYIYPMF